MILPELPEITAVNDNDILLVDVEDGTKKIKKSNIIPFNKSDIGAANGIASLDANGKVPSAQLPSYVDDVIEGYFNKTDNLFYEDAAFTKAIPGESGKIYIDLQSNNSYRFSGTIFVEISNSLALGETSSTAYRGDRGKEAYDTSQSNKNNIGTLSNLKTTDKTNLVNAINEVKSSASTLALGETSSTAYRGDRGKEAYETSQTNKTNISTINTSISTINTNIGKLSDLKTDDKTSLVNAINEVRTNSGGKYINEETLKAGEDTLTVTNNQIDYTKCDIHVYTTNPDVWPLSVIMTDTDVHTLILSFAKWDSDVGIKVVATLLE